MFLSKNSCSLLKILISLFYTKWIYDYFIVFRNSSGMVMFFSKAMKLILDRIRINRNFIRVDWKIQVFSCSVSTRVSFFFLCLLIFAFWLSTNFSMIGREFLLPSTVLIASISTIRRASMSFSFLMTRSTSLCSSCKVMHYHA